MYTKFYKLNILTLESSSQKMKNIKLAKYETASTCNPKDMYVVSAKSVYSYL